jgi:hypothetical protein
MRLRVIQTMEAVMALAIRGRGAAYDVRPTGESGFGFVGPFAGLIGFVKDAIQGSCSGLLALVGVSQLSGASGLATVGSEIESLDGLWQSLSASGLAGPVELFAGIVLFFAARRTIARTLGLLVFIAGVVAYAQGYTVTDMVSVLSSLLEHAAAILQSISAGTNA